MDIATLATTALTLTTPFLQKIGEGTSRKIGEDIWNLIKKTFLKKDKEIEKINTEEIKQVLIKILTENEQFRNELEELVINAQTQLNTVNQNVQNHSTVEKQVNIGTNSGNISL